MIHPPDPGQGHVPKTPAGAIAALLVGSAIIGFAIAIELERDRARNTRSFRYYLEVQPIEALPIRLYLPAPVDSHLTGALKLSNGTSTLHYELGGTESSVVAHVTGDVSFEITVSFLGPALDETLTRVSERPFSPSDRSNRNVSVELFGLGPGDGSALVILRIGFTQFCAGTSLEMEALVSAGSTRYQATESTVVC